ncbi:MAG: helicase, partial [Microvirga sp.]
MPMLAPSSLTDRARRNLTALATLDHIDQRGGQVTDHDRARLGLWTGWGALPQLFDPTVDREPFAGLRRDLEQRLTGVELRAASASTLNAHYTDPAVIDAVWRLCTAAGFAGGRVLEPGCGSGLFIGHAPDEVRRTSRFVGVEIEPVTARIAAALYPQAEIRPVGFETVRDPDGSFDLAVGNVPFGKYSLFDPIHNPERATIHNYFALKALHLVKPGGLVAIVTSRYTLDARNPAARRALYDLADLKAAIRLPNGAHRGVA